MVWVGVDGVVWIVAGAGLDSDVGADLTDQAQTQQFFATSTNIIWIFLLQNSEKAQ